MSFQKSLHPVLVPLVEECFRNDKINGQGGMMAITGVKSSLINGPTDKLCDRFTVSVPYCGSHIKWEVIFNHKYPTEPPDIVWSADDDINNFDPEIDNLQSLVDWNHKDNLSLSHLLEELLEEYRRHHKSLISSHQRLNFEYNTLKESNMSLSQIDIHCQPPTTKQSEPVTTFYIRLEVDFSTLPAYLSKDNPGASFAALTAVFHPPNASKVDISLYLSPSIERILGSAANIKLPSWNSEDSYLMDYVPNVHKILQEKVEGIVQNFVRRKEYIAALLGLMGQSVLEYDTESYMKIAFLFESNQGFCFIAHLNLTEAFPSEVPILSLYSIYHKYDGRPFQYILEGMPYSSHWDAEEKAWRMKTHIAQVIPKFMEICRTSGELL
ncbi:PREDICTED: BRCA1-A complex subunit BRE-like [Amphimedon queenslandica]|uniref:BRISC and BRCA1-A complex member 2 n=2 Tax=Amphimedon queenslandica TaxID=400682 RepID=A0A1X7U399_AMPQE|nr:PREDICTED: BRCA1-A complex subunit BRE-like [Amphimedon queenslandica]|eukprot:XP_019856252.1 PREDICTED: BRCA1-A complex subunit BRE-like [Amphimedon queenslandica]